MRSCVRPHSVNLFIFLLCRDYTWRSCEIYGSKYAAVQCQRAEREREREREIQITRIRSNACGRSLQMLMIYSAHENCTAQIAGAEPSIRRCLPTVFRFYNFVLCLSSFFAENKLNPEFSFCGAKTLQFEWDEWIGSGRCWHSLSKGKMLLRFRPCTVTWLPSVVENFVRADCTPHQMVHWSWTIKILK